jgi:hypothetical protein
MDLVTIEKWKLINSFAPWFSAVATFIAVLVSLYLATRQSRVRLQIWAEHRVLLGGSEKEPRDNLSISVVNTGNRKVRITSIGWKIGLFRKKYLIQIPDHGPYSSPLPVDLEYSQEAHWLIPFEGEVDWLKNSAREFLPKTPWLSSRFIRVQVFTSVGKLFEAPIGKNLRTRLVTERNAQLAQEKSE